MEIDRSASTTFLSQTGSNCGFSLGVLVLINYQCICCLQSKEARGEPKISDVPRGHQAVLEFRRIHQAYENLLADPERSAGAWQGGEAAWLWVTLTLTKTNQIQPETSWQMSQHSQFDAQATKLRIFITLFTVIES